MEKSTQIVVVILDEHRDAINGVKALLDVDDKKLSKRVENLFIQLCNGEKVESREINGLIQSVENLISKKTSADVIARFRQCFYDLADQITLQGAH